MKEIKIENLTNLKKVVEELNAPKVYEFEGVKEEFESPFNFVIKERDDIFKGCIAIYDTNEEYDYNYAENMSCITGHSCSDTIRPRLEAALEKDLGKEYYLEQQDSIIMFIAK